MSFIGREKELDQLAQFLSSPEPRIAAIYGRRRVGKSRLITEALAGHPVLIFEGLEDRAKRDQIKRFQSELQHLSGHAIKRVYDWVETLRQLYDVILAQPQTVVLDELQWMANYRSDLVSDLKYAWDRFLSKVPAQKLILCGSIASFMVDKVIKSSALYGRVDLEMEVPPFKLSETRQMLAGRGFDEILQAQMFTGGIPKYLEQLRPQPSILLGMETLALQRNGYLFGEYERIFTSHFGRNPVFQAIVQALADKPLGLLREDLEARIGASSGGTLTRHLRDLESAGFIRSDTPFHRGPDSREIKYFLYDAYLRFYFTFVHPNLKIIDTEASRGILSGPSGSGALNAWMGRAFEYVCIQHAREIATLAGFSAVKYSQGPYFVPHHKAGKEGMQLDLVFDREDKVITLCEMKYSTRPVGVEVLEDVERKAELLRPVSKEKTIQLVLICHPHATRDLVNKNRFFKIIEAQNLAFA